MLIRTLNDHFLDNEADIDAGLDNHQHQAHFTISGYLRAVNSFLITTCVDERIATFLCSKLADDRERLTHAFLEELELLMSIICQLLMQAEEMSKTGHGYGLL